MSKKASGATSAKKKKTAEASAPAPTKATVETTPVAAAPAEETQTQVAVAAPEVVSLQTPANKTNPNVLSVTISAQLKSKIRDQAADEGISVNEYVSELLAEGVVLRAWEIVERKAQMRGVGGNQQQGNNNRNNNNNNGGNNNNNNRRFNNNRRGGMSNNRYNAIMDDKANFLEYVRNQERQGR